MQSERRGNQGMDWEKLGHSRTKVKPGVRTGAAFQ